MIEIVIGFVIALAVGLTGVGAGSVTAPILMLFLRLPAPAAVGTALIFGAAIKFVAAPSYVWRKQVDFRVLSWMLAGGLPGAIAGSLLLDRLKGTEHSNWLYGALGIMIAASAAINLWRSFSRTAVRGSNDRRRWLPLITLPIGAEVGFSSAGSGALGSLALMGLTSLTAAQVVGTDVFYGLGVSLVGGGFHFGAGNYDAAVLGRLIVGGIAGVLIGANLSATLPSRPLRVAISVWLVSVGAQLLWRGLGN